MEPIAVDASRTSLAVLAGGQSKRMGIPKTSLQIRGRPILEYLLDRWRWPGPTLLVSAPSRRQPIGWKLFDHEVVDAVEGQGPLRGVLTALEAISTDVVIAVPVDMPCIGRQHLEWLLEELNHSPQSFGLAIKRRTDDGEQIEPFPFACRKSASKLIASHLESQNRSMHSLLSRQGFNTISPSRDWPDEAWINLNNPGDYEAFLASIH
jgi:molybdopterin-guanine dinucleotide biosynthesis protein A